MNDPNLAFVEVVAEELGLLCDELLLVGGCATGILITDKGRPAVRVTRDVDLVAEVVSLPGYYRVQEQLAQLGFAPEGEVICRFRKRDLIIDVMPAHEVGQGFTNRWYPTACRTAMRTSLPSGRVISVISAPLFLATKLEAFHGRGGGDYGHHDIEDIINVVDGRPELYEEVGAGEVEVREYLMQECEDLLADPMFIERLPWHLHGDDANQARIGIVIERLRKLAGL